MSAATRRVERMARHHRRHRSTRPPMTRREAWARLILEHGLDVVTGPFPCRPGGEVPLAFPWRRELQAFQATNGLTVDGILGAQSWALLARRNERVRALL